MTEQAQLFAPPARRTIDLRDAGPLLLDQAWLDPRAADEALAEILPGAPWFRPQLRIFGRMVLAPRTTAWFGDPAAVYSYSGSTNTPAPWLPVLAILRARVEEAAGAPFNSVLANLYRDGNDCVDWHADDERGLGPVIASLSLGAPRRFLIRRKAAHADKLTLELGHGSLLVMREGMQAHYEHTLPRISPADRVGQRVNLTWRMVAPRAAPASAG